MEDSLQEVLRRFHEKPYTLRMGAKNLARWWNIDEDVIRQAKKEYRKLYCNFLSAPSGKDVTHKPPKILLLDIETAPLKAYVWRLWKENIYPNQILADWFIISWAAKWLLEDEIVSQCLSSKEILNEDDERIVTTLWHLINKADIVVAHNGSVFDLPKIKLRFLVYGLPPTSFYQLIDTKKIVKSEFGFTSNSLDHIARTLGLEGKISVDFSLWSRCMEGDAEALKLMEEYNRNDVRLLEDVYLVIRPYIKGHPNYNLYVDADKPVCPHCGGSNLVFNGYYYFTPTGKYRNYRCLSCGALARERKTVLENRKFILVSNGR